MNRQERHRATGQTAARVIQITLRVQTKAEAIPKGERRKGRPKQIGKRDKAKPHHTNRHSPQRERPQGKQILTHTMNSPKTDRSRQNNTTRVPDRPRKQHRGNDNNREPNVGITPQPPKNPKGRGYMDLGGSTKEDT